MFEGGQLGSKQPKINLSLETLNWQVATDPPLNPIPYPPPPRWCLT